MSETNDGGPACGRCKAAASHKQGHQWLCPMHYRFGQMRACAKRNGKLVPSHEQLHNMLSYLIDFQCPHCFRKMNWLQRDGSPTQVTLQHYRSGSLGLICLSCNTRHGKMPGDEFCELPNGHKKCFGCDTVKPLTSFRGDNGKRWNNKQAYCRDCANSRHREWVNKNREYVNAKQREGRRRRGEVATCN